MSRDSCGYCGAVAMPLLLTGQTCGHVKHVLKHEQTCPWGHLGSVEYLDIVIRPSWEDIMIQFAHSLSMRSTCRRLQVGCVVVSGDFQRVLAVGYNGNASGFPNDCDSDEPGKCGCLHAEQNAIAKLDYNANCQKVAFLTDSPCKMCAKLLINAGISKVVYDREYRVKDGLDTLTLSGKVEVERYQRR